MEQTWITRIPAYRMTDELKTALPDMNATHQIITSCFPETDRNIQKTQSKYRILWRIGSEQDIETGERRPILIITSTDKPNLNRMITRYNDPGSFIKKYPIDRIAMELYKNQHLIDITVTMNPTRNSPREDGTHSRYGITDQKNQKKWLINKLLGFSKSGRTYEGIGIDFDTDRQGIIGINPAIKSTGDSDGPIRSSIKKIPTRKISPYTNTTNISKITERGVEFHSFSVYKVDFTIKWCKVVDPQNFAKALGQGAPTPAKAYGCGLVTFSFSA